MKMESSTIISNKSPEDPLLLSENNNTANNQADDSVALTTNDDTSQPEDEETQKQKNCVNARAKSTDDSSQGDEINQGTEDKEGQCSDEPQGGANSADVVDGEAGDLNEDSRVENAEDVVRETAVPEDTETRDEAVKDKVKQSDDNCGGRGEEMEKQEKEAKMDVDDRIGTVPAENDADEEKNEDKAMETSDSWSKMHLTEDVSEGNQVQPSSPTGHRASSSPKEDATSKPIQQNGIKDDAVSAAANPALSSVEIDRKPSNIVTNGSDHAANEDDEECGIKTDQTVNQGKSPEYVQSTDEIAANAVPPAKRRMSTSSGPDQMTAGHTNSKRLKTTMLESHDFQTRDQVLNSYMENMDCTGFEGLKRHSEQLLVEIQKLGELAKVKEREWNQLLHQKKLREELLLRLQRAKQIMVLQTNGSTNPKHQDQLLQRYQQQNSQTQQRQQQAQDSAPGLADKGRQGPLVDVQKMISDYRQTHPESIPRRGRRIRGQDGQGQPQVQRYDSGNLLTFSNVALGSGSQVRTSGSASVANVNQDIYNEFSLLLSSMDNDRLKTASSSAIKELLAQFARMSASERQDLLSSVKGPHNATGQTSTYPEVTVHAVQQTAAPCTSNSLLHGILTKPTKPTANPAPKEAKQQPSFSPTLARLLTAPEPRTTTSATTATTTARDKSLSSASSLKHPHHHHHKNTPSAPSQNNNHQSLSDLILSSTKARNEITITPVQQYEEHGKSATHHQDDEADDSADRLVIDEGDAQFGRNKPMEEEGAEEVPQCQGCNHKAAQFVCAGCGNQWYCSRECQVSAWDEHSEVCSG